ncbi:hypothetical protein [Tissierella sp.]|uniref:hypothetical protein n=1 Tax=Tissierella sp. TaxID=41274 RepID=UPI003071F80C
MKKYLKLKKILSFFLAIIILFTSGNISFASIRGRDWVVYSFQSIESKEHFRPGTIVPEDILNTTGAVNLNATFIPIKVREATITKAETKAYTNSQNGGWSQPPLGELVIDGQKHNYELPLKYLYRFTYDNDTREDFMPVWLMENYDKSQRVDPKEVEDLKEDFKEALDTIQSLADKIARQGEPKKPGDYHPMHKNYATNAIREWKQILLTTPNSTEFSQFLSREKIEASIPLLYDVVKYIESHRINEPEILDFKIGEYLGVIDKKNSLVNLYVPEGTELDKSQVEIITPDWIIGRYKSGDFKIGSSAIYSIRPIDASHDKYIEYYGLKDYGHMEMEWTVKVLEEEPRLLINSLNYTSEYGEKIDGIIGEDSINLDIPFGIDSQELYLDIYHTGDEAYYIDENNNEIKIEKNKNVNIEKINSIKILKDDLEKTYTLNVTLERSHNNEILYFGIDDYNVNIDHDNGRINITAPYGTDITALTPDIEIDYRASVVPKSKKTQDFTNPVIYTVTSESRKTKEYEVIVSHGIASSENKILSFRVGTIDGKIEGNNITVEVPNTVNLSNIKPFIGISPNAKVKPASSEEVDFSKGEIDYTVTSQNGEQRVYKVSVIHSQGEAVGPDEEYMNKLKQLRDNIYNKYKKEATREDWEWMNIGFYEGEKNGTSDGIRRKTEDLPQRFDMYNEIGELSSIKITDFARFAMTLTAMGVDATNLKPFQIDGKPFKTDLGRPSGKEVINIMEMMYNGGIGGINGGVFSLIAFDMGNYSIPANADITRDDYIEFLLNHEYGSDPYGIDMVAMLMQGLYPYQNHPVYGDEVMDKLEEGVELFRGDKLIKGVEPLNEKFLGISWGDVNSESTSQAIIALCSMGIDPFSDYRFSRGPEDNMIVNWINKFATPARDGFGHTNNSYNFMGTYQGMYALQWYINFVENGAKPYSLYHDAVPFDFSSNFRDEAEITYFELLGKEGIIDHEKGEINVEIPIDTEDEDLKTVPRINISENASISPKVGDIQDFTKEISYTVTAEDGSTTRTYRIKIEKGDVPSGQKDISSVYIKNFPNAKVNIDKQNRQISIILPSDTEESKLKNLVLNIGFKGRSINPNPSEPQDFSKDVIYTITAEDGSTAEFTVRVFIEEADAYEFTKFVLRGVEGEIDTIFNEIKINLPFGTYVEKIRPNRVEVEPDESTTSIVPAPTVLRTFEDENIYSINPYGGKLIEYNVKLNYVEVGGNSKITEFSIGNYTGKIEGKSIILEIPEGMSEKEFKESLKEKEPKIEWKGKTIDPMPGADNNSLNDYLKDYVLTDSEGNVNIYTVKFTGGTGTDPDDPNNSKENKIEITSFKVNGIEATIDNGNGRIFLEIPFETENYRVVPTIAMSENTEIYPRIGETIDLRKNNVYTLRKGDIYKQYILIVKRNPPKPATLLWRYMEEDLNIPYYQIVE